VCCRRDNKIKSKHFRALGANWIHGNWKIKDLGKIWSFYRGQENNVCLHFMKFIWTSNSSWDISKHTKTLFIRLTLLVFVIRSNAKDFQFNVDWCNTWIQLVSNRYVRISNIFTNCPHLPPPSGTDTAPSRVSFCGSIHGTIIFNLVHTVHSDTALGAL
jgi:hypothetical protein